MCIANRDRPVNPFARSRGIHPDPAGGLAHSGDWSVTSGHDPGHEISPSPAMLMPPRLSKLYVTSRSSNGFHDPFSRKRRDIANAILEAMRIPKSSTTRRNAHKQRVEPTLSRSTRENLRRESKPELRERPPTCDSQEPLASHKRIFFVIKTVFRTESLRNLVPEGGNPSEFFDWNVGNFFIVSGLESVLGCQFSIEKHLSSGRETHDFRLVIPIIRPQNLTDRRYCLDRSRTMKVDSVRAISARGSTGITIT